MIVDENEGAFKWVKIINRYNINNKLIIQFKKFAWIFISLYNGHCYMQIPT
jgi:hypothetical protein